MIRTHYRMLMSMLIIASMLIQPAKTAWGQSSSLVTNPGFELDTNSDTAPDSWSTSTRFTRSNLAVRSGSFAGRHAATDNSNHTITQTITGLTAGQSYTASIWINIPATSDAFTYSLQVRWRNSANISTALMAQRS